MATEEEATAKKAAAKLDEGDITGAIPQLCSSDTLAEYSLESLKALVTKHPSAPVNRRQPPVNYFQALVVSSEQVLKAIKSFPPGSSGGPDYLRPQHLKDMTERQIGGTLLISLTCFINLVLAGKVPVWVRPFFFGATLLAFNKKDGGTRPIAVGMTLRRLVAKSACHILSHQCLDYLKPRQLGVGVKGGAEALAHGARRFLQNIPDGHVFVKLDF